ncbi:MAG TPA: ABC transporter ATP-binding protein [Candidatus Limnocylindria bacterium]
MSGLEVRGLHAYYGDSHVLQGVDVDVRDGEAVALVGRNGAGKTTTIAAIMGSIRPRAGSVRVGTSEVAGQPAHRIARAGVALVPQGRRIFAELSVRENLHLAARAVTGGWNERRVLELFPALARRLGNRGDELSGGEQQMLAIGRALMRNPGVLLLDEPSEGLAPKLVTEMGEALRSLRGTGLAILLVEQNLGLATRVAERLYVMNKGTIVFGGTPAELAARPDIEASYLGV